MVDILIVLLILLAPFVLMAFHIFTLLYFYLEESHTFIHFKGQKLRTLKQTGPSEGV